MWPWSNSNDGAQTAEPDVMGEVVKWGSAGMIGLGIWTALAARAPVRRRRRRKGTRSRRR